MQVWCLHAGWDFPSVDSQLDPECGIIEELQAKRDSVKYTVSKDGTATIDVNGPMMTEVPLIFLYLNIPAVGTFNLLNTVNAAIADKDVERIHFNVNGPGGTSLGLEEVALAIHNSPKPTFGKTVEGAYSAHYWLLSQMDEIEVSVSANVGSLGSYLAISDVSKAFENAGVKQYVFSSGPVKGIGVIGSELTEDQQKFLSKKVTETTNTFKNAVRRGRGSKIENVDALFTGEWWSANNAVKIGLADRVTLGGTMTKEKNSGSEVTEPKAKSVETVVAPDLSGIEASLKTLTENMAGIASVVNGLVESQNKATTESVIGEAVKSGAVNAEDSEKAEGLLSKVGVETFRELMSLRSGVEANPMPGSGGGANIRRGEDATFTQAEKEQLAAWGAPVEAVAKYHNVVSIDVYNREYKTANSTKTKSFGWSPISNLTDGFTVNGIPNGELKKLSLQKKIEAVSMEDIG